MAANSKFAVATHILLALAQRAAQTKDGGDAFLSSEFLAGSVNTNPVVVRRIVSHLAKTGLVDCRQGKRGGARLGKPANKITLRHVYETLGKEAVFAFNPNEPNPLCAVSRRMPQVLEPIFKAVEEGIREKLGKIRLTDLEI